MRGFGRAVARVIVALAYVACGWLVGLVWLVALLLRGLRLADRLRRALAPTQRCPRGHTVPVYGLYRCAACRARTESLAWRCPNCRTWAGFVSCPDPTCGVAVRNPLAE